MEIRKTRVEDLQEILKIYESARAFMRANGNPTQWGNHYPSKELVESDIQQGKSYVCVAEEKILGTFYFACEEDETYVRIDKGQWLNEEPYGVVHRIAVKESSRGVASFCLNWAFERCHNLKIDTHQDNIIMQKTLEKNGFKACGIIYLPGGEPRIGYHKA